MKDDQPKGLLIDFWRLYGERSGTNIVFNLVGWQPSLDEVVQGHANIHAGLVYSKARAELYEFGSVLFNVQTSIYIDINLINIIDEDLNNIKQPVGVVEGGHEEGVVRKNYAHLKLITYANNALLFEAIRKQEISIFVADKQVTNFYMVSFSDRANDFVSLKEM
jgi:ABC-type amino acid transport substrate-binding protein